MALFKEFNGEVKGKDLVEYITKNNLGEYVIKIQDEGFLIIENITDIEVSHADQVMVISVMEEE